MSYFTLEEDLKQLHIQIPKALLYEKKYTGEKRLSNDAKLLYGFFLDRVSLSLKNGWFDEHNRLYIKCDQITMSKVIGCSEKKSRKIRDELIEFDLLEEVKKGQGQSNLLYPKKVFVSTTELEDYIDTFSKEVNIKREEERNRVANYRSNNVETVETALNGQNDRTRTDEMTVQEQSKLPYSNTDFSNTDFKDDVDDAKKIIDLYKTFKLEKRVMPHTLNLLKSNTHISLDVFEQIFIDASEDGVVKKYKYIKTIIEDLNAKNVTTLCDFEKYNKDFKQSKMKLNVKGSSSKVRKKTTAHEINQTYKKYESKELENILQDSQKDKFKEINLKNEVPMTQETNENSSSDWKW